MDISRRLSKIGQMVKPGMILADIGTDHAYVPASLLLEKKIPSAIAMDLREGPLAHAAQTLRTYHIEDKVQLRLSDGLAALKEGEAECAVIAGMGGELIVRIIEKDKAVAMSLRELILGPQSELEKVRSYLRENGWTIADEEMVEEDGKYYPLLKVRRIEAGEAACADSAAAEKDISKRTDRSLAEKDAVQHPCSESADKDKTLLQQVEDLYGPVLLRKSSPELAAYLAWEQSILLRNQERLQKAASESGIKRRAEIEDKLALNRRAQEMCR